MGKNNIVAMQALLDIGLNAFAAELLIESYESMPKEIKERLPEVLTFRINNSEISLKSINEKEGA